MDPNQKPEPIQTATPAKSPQSGQKQPQNYLPGIRQLLGQDWQIFKGRWETLIVIFVIPLVSIPTLFFLMMLFSIILGKNNTSILIFTGIIYCLAFLLQLWSHLAQLYAIKDRDEKIGFRMSYEKSLRRLPLYVILMILMAVITTFGYVLFIIPGIIFSVWFSLAPYIFIAENTGPIEALKKSKEYISGKFFETLYRQIGIGFITGSITLILIPTLFFGGLLIIPVLSIISIIYSFLLYENLKVLNGKSISNPVNKIIVALIVVIPIILIVCFFATAVFMGSILTKNLIKKPKSPTYLQLNQNKNNVNVPNLQQFPRVQQPTQENNSISNVAVRAPKSVTVFDHIRGNMSAEVTLIEYADFECLFCKVFNSTMQRLLGVYGDKIRLVFRHYPLPSHQNAQKTAEASECIASLGGDDAFWKFVDAIYERPVSNVAGLTLDKFGILAEEVGVNQQQFQSCLDSGKYEKLVKDSIAEGSASGVSSTPSTFIIDSKGNSQLIVGAQSIGIFKTAIDKVLNGK